METSHSEHLPAVASLDEVDAGSISPSPTPMEAAVISAAIHAHITATAGAEAAGAADWWDERSWRLHHRTSTVRGGASRPREGLPTDPWRAADRLQRF